MSWPAAFRPWCLYATVALVGACIVFLLVLLLVAMRRTGSLRARRAASAEIRPALRAALVEFLAGGTDDSLFRRHIRTHPADIAASILLFQTTVGGSARDRLCALALDLGLVHRWYDESRIARRGPPPRAPSPTSPSRSPTSPAAGEAGDLLMRSFERRR